MKKLLSKDYVRFVLVGTVGFLVNLTLLTILYKKLGMALFIAQLISSEIALFGNFLLHHHWTYKNHNVVKSLKSLIIQFHMTSWVAIVGSAVLVSFGSQVLKLNYFVSLVIASGIAMVWNYLWTKLFVWRHNQQQNEGE